MKEELHKIFVEIGTVDIKIKELQEEKNQLLGKLYQYALENTKE